MEVKEAVRTAKDWLSNVLADEGVSNIGLEEIKFDSDKNVWMITLGFSRPWNMMNNAFTKITGEPVSQRDYKVISLENNTGTIISMTRPADP